MLADRFEVEIRYVLTQSGRSQNDLSVKLEAKCRLVIKKTIPMSGVIFSSAKTQLARGTAKIWENANRFLAQSFQDRISGKKEEKHEDALFEVRSLLDGMKNAYDNEFVVVDRDL